MSPARNRVTPTGEIVAVPLRGAWTGNRGILHRDRDIVRFHGGDLWIICALAFKGRHQEQWRPGHYTFLFFHDEAVALAAGHRPCAECRRPAYNAYRAAWAEGLGVGLPSAREMNRRLHGERLVAGTHRRRRPRPRTGRAVVLTPPSTIAALRAGYEAQIDPSARQGSRLTASWETTMRHPGSSRSQM